MPVAAIAAVVSAGVGVAGAAGAFNPDSPDAPNYGQMTRDAQQAQIDLLPAKYEAQTEYDPKFAALQSTIAWNNLFGTEATTGSTTEQVAGGWYDTSGNLVSSNRDEFTRARFQEKNSQPNYFGKINTGAGAFQDPNPNGYVWRDPFTKVVDSSTPASPGTLAMMEAAAPRINALATAQRAQEVKDVATLGPEAYAAIRNYNPQATALLDEMGNQASDRLATKGALDPFLARALQQQYRAAATARGMAGGVGDAAMEAYYQAATQEDRQLKNISLAGAVAGQQASYYGDPFMQVLQRTSGRSNTPISYTANQPSSIGDSTGALSLASQGYAAKNAANIAGYNQQMANMGNIGTSIQGLGNGIQGLYNYFSTPSAATQSAVASSVAAGPVDYIPGYY